MFLIVRVFSVQYEEQGQGLSLERGEATVQEQNEGNYTVQIRIEFTLISKLFKN